MKIDPNLHGIARTLLVPLACRATETVRPDAILHDPRAVEVYNALGSSPDFLMGMRGTDVFVTVMRARQFDRFARAFLAKNPGGLVVDLVELDDVAAELRALAGVFWGLVLFAHAALEVERLVNASGPTGGEVILRDGRKPKRIGNPTKQPFIEVKAVN